jgi:CubicO group peptidase (beta-lactamase class C family)
LLVCALQEAKAPTRINREDTMTNLKSTLDGILTKVTSGEAKSRVPGVVAMLTDRKGNTYEGAAGERVLGSGNAMTMDSVHAIFSTTKAITGTAIMQCLEEGSCNQASMSTVILCSGAVYFGVKTSA